ncbi:hypothetical protein MAPG_11703 [Magnaporthiopsis poae ATCC 64411]|uniref:Uncharacterized protein n=1 Tax=Magnaporthiopsis poae (strain ATCC 64411 / 73-15) TaxID=644358 RepID=A0A0C4EFZ1_MAGP6|nr:hypothetical protein MAPG_11703 [Magnaporthiopsis poae ATCC 64411]
MGMVARTIMKAGDGMAELMRKHRPLPPFKNAFVDASSSSPLLIEDRHINTHIVIVNDLANAMEDQTCSEELRKHILHYLKRP